MSANEIAYWRNWINNKQEIPITEDGYIVRYTLANQHSGNWVRHWVCCTSQKKLYTFIKYVLLPSIIISKNMGLKDGEVYLDVCEYDETIGILEHAAEEGYEKALEDYIKWFEEMKTIEDKGADFKEIRSFLNKVSSENDFREGLFLEFGVYENISSVGRTLIREFKEDDMVEDLEDMMELSCEEIENLFDNIKGNKFMLRKITTLLNERLY
ncbi:hypothetical protein [Clostridium sp.]|uniref:hypothetical protein n=1 Tax=Clostridium sp. TaxID=1506 RepID=UPI002FC8B061